MGHLPLVGAVLALAAIAAGQNITCNSNQQNFFSLSAKAQDGSTHSLSQYAGNVTLVVNVAAFCGETVVNFAELNQLATKYAGKPFQVLAFPCNQFLQQSPGTDQEFMNTLRYVRPGNNYVPLFPVFSKINVNGDQAAPVYTYLRKVCPVVPGGVIGAPQYLSWSPVTISDIAWNFEKFLVDKDGYVVRRYSTPVDPLTIEPDIIALLGK